MNEISCLIVEDEPLAAELLKTYIDKVPFLSLVRSCRNGKEAYDWLQENKVDLLFLDVEMPGINGMELLGLLDKKVPAIFVTAYPKYAVEGFNHNAIDYLVKPVEFGRFVQAANKAKNQLLPTAYPTEATAEAEHTTNYIFLKTAYKIVRVDLADILFVEGLKDYMKVVCQNETILSLITMKELQAELPEQRFARVHKSYIVSLSKVDAVERNKVRIGKKLIPIGATYKQTFLQQLG